MLHQRYTSSENNIYAARFHFRFALKYGEIGEGEYMDEFTFANNSTQLFHVSMFENLKFNGKNEFDNPPSKKSSYETSLPNGY